MRTTLTLEDDVAALLNRLVEERKTSLKELVNDALRRGLADLEVDRGKRPRYRTRAVSLGALRAGSLDDVAEALSAAEGDGFR